MGLHPYYLVGAGDARFLFHLTVKKVRGWSAVKRTDSLHACEAWVDLAIDPLASRRSIGGCALHEAALVRAARSGHRNCAAD
jgi:hypothetical protein